MLKAGVCPLALADYEKNLHQLGVEAFESPDGFWEKLDRFPIVHNIVSTLGRFSPETETVVGAMHSMPF
jgi:hypothetical protein